MKNVMIRAWGIAKAAVVKFGGKAKKYFAQALTIAWAEHKAPKYSERITNICNRDTKTYKRIR